MYERAASTERRLGAPSLWGCVLVARAAVDGGAGACAGRRQPVAPYSMPQKRHRRQRQRQREESGDDKPAPLWLERAWSQETALPKNVPSPSNCSDLCLDSCKHHVRDGQCDELSGVCSRGTDCTDCGGERRACTASALPSSVPRAGAPEAEVCVATIMTADRVGSLHRLAASWPGMLSIAFLSAAFERDVGLGMRLLHLDGRPPPLSARLALTVVRDEGYTSPRNRFPFNMLRNRAVAGCEAGAVLVVDVDFVLYAAMSKPRPVCGRPSRPRRLTGRGWPKLGAA